MLDAQYIGKANPFDNSSHVIEFEILDERHIRFDHKDYGRVKQGEEWEIDVIKEDSYTVFVDSTGKMQKTHLPHHNKP